MGFLIGHTHRIAALDKAFDMGRHLDHAFFRHLVIPNDIDPRRRSHQRDMPDLLVRTILVCDLDNRFRPDPLALQIGSESHLMRRPIQPQQFDYLEQTGRRNVVDHRPVFDRADLQNALFMIFSFFRHDYELL